MKGSFYISKQFFYSKLTYYINYFSTLTVSFHQVNSLYGFIIFSILINQLVSGVMLALSFVPETMLVPLIREEEDLENLYIDDFFWLHERGVDALFIVVFLHLFRKLFINVNDLEQDFAWKSGTWSFLILQVVVFLGLVLCCSHLSEITLTIAVNALHSIFMFKGSAYWWIFTDKFLNTDTLIRVTYLHYLSAFFLFYLGLLHGTDMHYDWKNQQKTLGIKQELAWWDEAFSNELAKLMLFIFFFLLIGSYLYVEPEALSYELFMWGDIGFITDIRFYGVAPHWYFRPYMAWLISCPNHYLGLSGLLFFFLILYFQPNILGFSDSIMYKSQKTIFYLLWTQTVSYNKYIFRFQRTFSNQSLYFLVTYMFFIAAVASTLSFLPYGRFYTRMGGNSALLVSFFYIFIYLGTRTLRTSIIFESAKINLIN